MKKWVRVTQLVLGMVAIALVVSLLLGPVLAGQGRNAPESTTTPEKPGKGERLPGTPERPLREHEKLPLPNPRNQDRQLGYRPTTKPRIGFHASLGDLTAYATQPVEWKSCPSGAGQCAKVKVPLDWDKPAGEAIEIALRRVPTGGSSRGPLFVNPGGPGFGGQDLAQQVAKTQAHAWDGYDIIGWDPRGTGESTHVVCGSLQQTDAVMDLDSSPDDAAEEKALKDGAADLAKQCRDGSGKLLDHLSTLDGVRDLDLLRHLLGAKRLNYVGISYGTYIGALYAELFPKTVGRMVLDSAVDITGSDEVQQVDGFELALNNFTKWCATEDACPLGTDQKKINEAILAFLTKLDREPITVANRRLTQHHAALGIASFLYQDEEAYETLGVTLDAAMNGDGNELLAVADQFNGREPGGYATSTFAFPAISCVDSPDEGASPVLSEWKKAVADTPILGVSMGVSYTCERWTADSVAPLKITAKGAAPILVVGTTGDSATPYAQAKSMAKQLDSGVLLTLKGAGHGAVLGRNRCISDAVAAYLLGGKPPRDGMTCT